MTVGGTMFWAVVSFDYDAHSMRISDFKPCDTKCETDLVGRLDEGVTLM